MKRTLADYRKRTTDFVWMYGGRGRIRNVRKDNRPRADLTGVWKTAGDELLVNVFSGNEVIPPDFGESTFTSVGLRLASKGNIRDSEGVKLYSVMPKRPFYLHVVYLTEVDGDGVYAKAQVMIALAPVKIPYVEVTNFVIQSSFSGRGIGGSIGNSTSEVFITK